MSTFRLAWADWRKVWWLLPKSSWLELHDINETVHKAEEAKGVPGRDTVTGGSWSRPTLRKKLTHTKLHTKNGNLGSKE